MPQIILYNQHSDNEHCFVTVENYKCSICNQQTKVIVCDNSEGNNNGIALCLKCCTKILNKS